MEDQTPDPDQGAGERPRPDAPVAPDGPEGTTVEGLDRLAGLPVAEHVAVFEAVHDDLRARLDDTGT